MQVKFRIADLHKARKITQAELAKRLEFRSAASAAIWETGVRKPTSDILPSLAQELGCSIQDLYTQQSA